MNDHALTPSSAPHDAAALLHLGLDSTLGRSAAAPVALPVLPGFPQLELIGRGGMGVVYRARQDSLERTVAIKVIAAELSSEPEFEARFVREARLLARLDHPHIVAVIDHGRCDGSLYLVMEHVDGRTLRDALSQPMAPDVALRIASQVCDALAYSHACE